MIEKSQIDNIHSSKNSAINDIQPLFLLSSLIGTRKVRLHNKQIVEISTFEKLYSTTFLIFLLFLFIYYGQERFFTLKNINLNYAITDLFALLSLLITCCNAILISTFFSYDCIKDFFDNIKAIDEILSFNSDSKLKLKIIAILSGHFFLISFETILNVLAWNLSMSMVLWFSSYLIIDWTNFELMIYLYYLEKRVVQLESFLILYRNDRIQKSLTGFIGNNMKINRTPPLNRKLSNKRVLELMTVYDKISDNAHILNVTFGSSVYSFEKIVKNIEIEPSFRFILIKNLYF